VQGVGVHVEHFRNGAVERPKILRIPAKDARHFDLFVHYGIAAGTQALRDSGLQVTDSASQEGVPLGYRRHQVVVPIVTGARFFRLEAVEAGP
jgi:3-oxoacyl-(acyl-carrier-protein) synthase